jgi:cell division protein FtsZ
MSETGMAMMGSGTASGESRARQAAEAAVSSPLLEDINLAGAHGILVNVTAGLDLSIGEFEEVGSIVKEYASDDATVVVGTVIDPDMSNQIRVTVVATGLGRGAAPHRGRGEPARDSFIERASMARESSVSREAAAARTADTGQHRAARGRGPLTPSDYSALDKPTIVRQRAVGDGMPAAPEAEEMLDIPAFLRRQAD